MRASLAVLCLALLAAPAVAQIAVGSAAPRFKVNDHAGAARVFGGPGGWRLLAFYPKASTPGCTREVCSLRDAMKDLEALDLEVYGISIDDVKAQARFHREQGLNFPLLSDVDGRVAEAYDVARMGLRFAARVSFLVGPEGKVRDVVSSVDVNAHGEQVAAALKKVRAVAGGGTSQTGVLDEQAFEALHRLKEGEAPALRGRMVEVGGTKAYLAMPEGAEGPLPAVLVIHEWWGLNAHIKHWADRLAKEGYAALAVDLYGGKVGTTPREARALMMGTDEAAAKRTLAAGLDFLRKHEAIRAPKVASLGWCFGGGWSLRCALMDASLDAAVIYYGRLVTDPSALKAIGAEVLGVFGTEDPSIPMEVVKAFDAALGAAGVKHTIHAYDAPHAFANPSSARYDKESARAAWQEVRAFLARKLRGA